ncbi:MAG: protoglobin domain-containing protein, partial [Devosia sp.]
MTPEIPGYSAGAQTLARSPLSLEAFATMQKSVLFDDQDVRALRQSYDVVKDQVEAILDVWYGFVGSQPHLLASFTHRDSGAPLGDYLGAVRRRFGQWILDTARADYDQAWLDYQHEIGLRHH